MREVLLRIRGHHPWAKRISLVALFAAFPLALPSPAASVEKRTFHDAVGDVYCCTRDLTDVVVRNDDAGTITFDIHYDATAEGEDDDDLYVSLDTDRNPATGERHPRMGVDFMIAAHVGARGAHAVTLFTWQGRRMHEQPTKRIRVTVTAKVIRVTLDRHLIGDTDGFDIQIAFWEVAQGNAYSDAGPERGSWSFPVRIATRRLRPTLATSRHPRAGHRFVGRLSLRVAGTKRRLGSGRVQCRAALGSRRLEPIFAAFAGRRAVCAWRLPSHSRGMRIRGSVGVAITSRAYVARRFAAVIR
jgi:hypothetical protein